MAGTSPSSPSSPPHTPAPAVERQHSTRSSPRSSSSSWEKDGQTNASDSTIDLNSLVRRLNDYKDRNGEVLTRLRQQRSFSSKEAHDVAAAARFRLRLDQDKSMTTAPIDDEYTIRLRRTFSSEGLPSMTRSRLTRTRDSQAEVRRRKITRPPPLQLHYDSVVPPQEVQSAALPERTSSRRAMQDFFKAGHRDSLLQRRATISGISQDASAFPVRTVSKTSVPPMPTWSKAHSSTMIVGSSTESPDLTEDQFRQEDEDLLLVEERHAAKSEQRRSRKLAQMLSTEAEKELWATQTFSSQGTLTKHGLTHGSKPSISPAQPVARKKNVFGWLQKRSEVDELIELYMDDHQVEQPKRQLSKNRGRAFRSTRVVTDPLPVKRTAAE